MSRRYRFRPKNSPVLTMWTARRVVEAADRGQSMVRISLDLGLTKTAVEICGGEVLIGGSAIDIPALKTVAESGADYVHVIDGGEIRKVAFFSDSKFYKLKALGEEVSPTVEISGIHMHRIERTTPWKDSRAKIEAIGVRPGHKVLDICTGLGYTAILSLEAGAKSVVTVEKDLNVLVIAEYNPWSKKLASDRISIVLDDAAEAVSDMDDEAFDRVIHDPPRFSLAGELYSLEFYKELYRLLKPKGAVFHYVGAPGSKYRGKDLMKGVSKRLKEAGFITRVVRSLGGVIAIKPAV